MLHTAHRQSLQAAAVCQAHDPHHMLGLGAGQAPDWVPAAAHAVPAVQGIQAWIARVNARAFGRGLANGHMNGHASGHAPAQEAQLQPALA